MGRTDYEQRFAEHEHVNGKTAVDLGDESLDKIQRTVTHVHRQVTVPHSQVAHSLNPINQTLSLLLALVSDRFAARTLPRQTYNGARTGRSYAETWFIPITPGIATGRVLPRPMSPTNSFFVYGTLKHDSVRASLWPYAPLRIVSAEIRGVLFDLGPYPAVVEGELRIWGERWDFLPEQITNTLALLDRIEGYGQDADNLYVRRVVDCWDEANICVPSFAYFFADRSWAAQHPQVPPNEHGRCVWNAPPGSQPITHLDD